MAKNLGNLFIDGESVIEDETGNHTITNNNGVTISTAEKKYNNSSLEFDGTNYLSISDHSDFQFSTGDFTVDFWVKLNNREYYK